MPNNGVLYAICLELLRGERGIRGVTREAVGEHLKALKMPQGSNRDVGPVVRKFKAEYGALEVAPEAVRNQIEELATTIWRIALMTGKGLSPQAEPLVRRVPAERKAKPQNMPRLDLLKQCVEDLLSDRIVGKRRVTEPLGPVDIFKRLAGKDAKLTDVHHISRDLRKIESDILFMVRGKWWRKDRELPVGFTGPRIKKRAPRRDTEKANTRLDNERRFRDIAMFMLGQAQPVTIEEIWEGMKVRKGDQREVYDLVRNRTRGKHPKLRWDERGFELIGQTRRQG